MSQPSISAAWQASFGKALPAGYLCRATLPERWMRIHSLPESKRYPESEDERREILRRHGAAALYALGEDSECVLFITLHGESRNWSDYLGEGTRYSPEFLMLDRLAPEHVQSLDKGDDGVLQFFATRQRWRTGAFDELILMCADGIAGPYLFASTEGGSAYAPYDGGADLFFSSADAVSKAREKFSSWLSTTESGL
ncbi:MAG: hypothetical protein V4858_20605 [Pseudomonadota bacterium]